MLKKSLIILSLCSVFSPLAQAGDDYNISGDEDRPIPVTNARYELVRCEGQKNVRVVLDSGNKDREVIQENLFISMRDPLYKYGIDGVVFNGRFKLKKEALGALGLKESNASVGRKLGLLHLDSKKTEETISSTALRRELLEIPLRDLITFESEYALYETLLRGINSSNFITKKKVVTIEQLRERLPNHLPFKEFLIDPRNLFTEKDPNLSTFSITEGTINIEAQLMKKPTGTCTFTMKVTPKDSDLISFTVDPTLVQDDEVTRLMTSEKVQDFERALLPEVLQQTRIKDLLGGMGFKNLIGVLSSQPFRKKGEPETLDYTDLSGNLSLLQFSQLLSAKLGTAQLVTWAGEK